MSQEFVKRRLKAPSTAEFPWFSDDQVRVQIKPGCKFVIVGYVDAQNGFGAQIRTRYISELEYQQSARKWYNHSTVLLE